MIVMMAGLPGTGKSTLARALAERLGGMVLDKDLIRAGVFPPKLIEYSTKQDDHVMQFMLDEAEYVLRVQPARIIFLDGRPFSKKYQVDAVVEFAKSIGTPWRVVECVCPEDVALRRLKEDLDHIAKNRGPALYQKVKASFQRIRRRKLVVQTTSKLGTSLLGKIEEYLLPE
jgi:adenylylsulfate kinase